VKKKISILAAVVLVGIGGSVWSQRQASAASPTAGEAAATSDATATTPQPSPPELDADDLEAWLDGYMAGSLEQAKIAGAVVSVVRDGSVLLSKGYGYADFAEKTPMDPGRTLVRVGSTSKLFTWTAVMQLFEQGKLDLDEDVNAYLDFQIPERSDGPVTMNDLMTHRGGFEEGLREILITDPEKFISTEDYLKEHPRPRMFPAGEVPAYSNYGTALAGYIVERISGEPFEEYVDRHILTPLDMRQSTFHQPLPADLQNEMSEGYMSSSGPPLAFEMVTTAPAGALSATADDMANFMIAHLQAGRFEEEQILKPETASLMHSPSVEQPLGFATMAHGFFSGTQNGEWVIGHGGDTVVFHTDLNLLPEEGVGIFVSFNSRGAGDAVYGVRRRLFDDFMDRYFPGPTLDQDPPAIDDAAANARAIAGKYHSSRRIETAFLRLLYILWQTEVTANDDGTISLSSIRDTKFREIAPGLWREEGGDHELQISRVNGSVTIVDSNNPTSVLQPVPAVRNATLNMFILLGSVVVLLLVLGAWPIGWWYRRLYSQPLRLSGRPLRAARLTRFAALADLAYLVGWYLALQPVLQNRLDAYGPSLDGLLRTLQIGAVVPIAGASVGLWNAWLTIRSNRHWAAKVGSVLLAAALIGIVWLAWVGGLMSFNLEY
jgi:CubicO group peptidase (beta-lactamase class C family)